MQQQKATNPRPITCNSRKSMQHTAACIFLLWCWRHAPTALIRTISRSGRHRSKACLDQHMATLFPYRTVSLLMAVTTRLVYSRCCYWRDIERRKGSRSKACNWLSCTCSEARATRQHCTTSPVGELDRGPLQLRKRC